MTFVEASVSEMMVARFCACESTDSDHESRFLNRVLHDDSWVSDSRLSGNGLGICRRGIGSIGGEEDASRSRRSKR